MLSYALCYFTRIPLNLINSNDIKLLFIIDGKPNVCTNTMHDGRREEDTSSKEKVEGYRGYKWNRFAISRNNLVITKTGNGHNKHILYSEYVEIKMSLVRCQQRISLHFDFVHFEEKLGGFSEQHSVPLWPRVCSLNWRKDFTYNLKVAPHHAFYLCCYTFSLLLFTKFSPERISFTWIFPVFTFFINHLN